MASKKFQCPKCRKNNYSFDTAKLKGQCWNCGYAGGGEAELRRLGAQRTYDSPKIVVPGTSPQLTAPTTLGKEYLGFRGVTPNDAANIGIRWDGNELYFPIWSPFYKDRSWVRKDPEKPGYYSDALKGEPFLFGAPKIRDRTSVVLVEGIFDLLTTRLWGRGYALLGSNLHERIEMWLQRQHFTRIYLWLDPDHTGMTKAKGIYERLSSWHPDVTRVHGWAMDGRDPGEYDPTEARRLLFLARRRQCVNPPMSSTVSLNPIQHMLWNRVGKTRVED